jgi:parallel beta-helix repeat protein
MNRQILITIPSILLLTLIVATSIVGASANYIISDSATGGDAKLIGTWDRAAKTCTMTKIVHGTIQINGIGITLDGAGHSIIGDGTGSGISPFMGVGTTSSVLKKVTIKDATIKNFEYGVSNSATISTYPSSLNIIGCKILNNHYGIMTDGGYYDTFKGNTIKSNSIGISLWDSSNENIIDNTISNNGDGILTDGEFSGDLISGNIISSNSGDGINGKDLWLSTISDNTISKNNGVGIEVIGTYSNNIISKNTVSKCGTGIDIAVFCNHNDVFDNRVRENQVGISVTHNLAFGTDFTPNKIHNNCFGKNTLNAKGQGYDSFFSNHYSDYTGLDANRDGIGDTP